MINPTFTSSLCCKRARVPELIIRSIKLFCRLSYILTVWSINPAFKKKLWLIYTANTAPQGVFRGEKGVFLLVARMTLVKQASPELCGCQAHMKERSISPTRVSLLIDEGGERGGLSLFQMVFTSETPDSTS